MTGKRGRRRTQLLDNLKEKWVLEIDRGSTISHSVENWLWQRIWTCCERDCVINESGKGKEGWRNFETVIF
jgi:hypothetical protein